MKLTAIMETQNKKRKRENKKVNSKKQKINYKKKILEDLGKLKVTRFRVTPEQGFCRVSVSPLVVSYQTGTVLVGSCTDGSVR